MKCKKMIAAALSAAMIFGGTVSVLADNEMKGKATVARGVLNEVVSIKVPASNELGVKFNFMVDPERRAEDAGAAFIVGSGGTGTSTRAVTASSAGAAFSDGVFFFNSSDGVFDSKSEVLSVDVKAYYEMDVIVEAAVSSGGTMPFVGSDGALDNADMPSLALKMSLEGTESDGSTAIDSAGAYITGSGNSIRVKVAGNPDGYEPSTSTSSEGVYTLTASSGTTVPWGKAKFRLSGKTTENKEVPKEGLTIPDITYTFNCQRHYKEQKAYGEWENGTLLWLNKAENAAFSDNGGADLTVQVSKDGEYYTDVPTSLWAIKEDSDLEWVTMEWDDIIKTIDPSGKMEEDDIEAECYMAVIQGDTRYTVKLSDAIYK